ncbi:chemotaxis protein CheX [bacterium]|nr:chemotaxis protein CheX [bacterium]
MNADSIDTTLVDTILATFSQVFSSLFMIETNRGKMSFKTDDFDGYEVAVVTGVIGENHEGVIAYRLTESTARDLVNAMDMEDEMSSYGEMFFDVIGEWMNILAGNISTALNSQGTKLYISPPSIIHGSDYTLQLIQMAPLMVEMRTPAGKIGVHFAIKKIFHKDLEIHS